MAFPIAAAIGVGSALLGAFGSSKSADASKKAAREAERMAKEHAAFAEENAEIHASQARQEAAQIDRQNRLRLGSITAAAGASGGRLSAGSVGDILADVAAQGELQRQDALFRGFLRGRSERQAARGFQSQAMLASAQARGAVTSGRIGTAAALLSGASDVIGLI